MIYPGGCDRSGEAWPWPGPIPKDQTIPKTKETTSPDRRASDMRLFHLLRLEDESGVSGTGIVAEGVEFSNGTCCLRWKTKVACTAIYNSIRDLEAIHGHGGKTQVVWLK